MRRLHFFQGLMDVVALPAGFLVVDLHVERQGEFAAGENIFRALSTYLDPVFASSKFALSFDMQINDKETSWKRNNIHEALKAEAAHG